MFLRRIFAFTAPEKGGFRAEEAEGGEGKRDFCLHRSSFDFQQVAKPIFVLPSLAFARNALTIKEKSPFAKAKRQKQKKTGGETPEKGGFIEEGRRLDGRKNEWGELRGVCGEGENINRQTRQSAEEAPTLPCLLLKCKAWFIVSRT